MTKGFGQAAGIDTMGYDMINVLRVATAVAGLGLTLAGSFAAPALANTGSGTVTFAFTRFTGPFSFGNPSYAGVLNNNLIVPDAVPGFAPDGPYPFSGYETGSQAIAGAPNSVEFRYGIVPTGDALANIISFMPETFTDIPLGQDFKLGTLNFQNGGWFGAGQDASYNTPTLFEFTMSTLSANGAAFNQTITGTIVVTVNSPYPNDIDTLGGQEAEADWVSITSSATVAPFGAFRVFDLCCKPAGSTNIASIDVIGRFNSLDLVGFSNPTGGGFLTPDTNPLPPVLPIPPGGGGGGGGPGAVPEPASWAMLIAGFGLTGAAMRRQRVRVA